MRSGFYNSNIIGYDDESMPIFDRAQDAEFFASFFKAFFTNGVFPTPANAFQVVSTSGMNVVVNPGRGHIEGYFAIEDVQRELVVQAAESLDRIDRVVLRLNLLDRTIDLYVLKGSTATIPVAPALTRPASGQGGDIYELGIADVFITKNSTSISQAKITDTRLNSELCGIVTQTVQNLNTSVYYEQLQAMLASSANDFMYWFDNVKGILDDDTAGNLLNLITDLQTNKSNKGRSSKVVAMIDQWFPSGMFPYVQTVYVNGMTADDRPIVYLEFDDSYNVSARQAVAEEFAKVNEVIAYDGYMHLICYVINPIWNLPLRVVLGDYGG